MFGNTSSSAILNDFISVLFALWPAFLLAPLRWRRNALKGMAIIWSGLAIIRVLLALGSLPISAILIPEPLNTVVFIVAGGVLFLLKFGHGLLKRRDIQHKADRATRSDDLLHLSPREFEDMVVELYQAMGHKAKRTGATGDHGVDVVVQARNGEKWVVQCKRWRGTVGEPIVRDFHGVMQHEKADQGAIITTGKFSFQAKEWAKGKPLTLVEGDEFLAHLKRVRRLPQPTPAMLERNLGATDAVIPPYCPKCGSKMVLRIAKRGVNQGGKFWGCPNFPSCRGIVEYVA